MKKNDNRYYHFSLNSSSSRDEYPIIEACIPFRSHVIDLGAGDGSLLKRLTTNRKVTYEGIEISKSGVSSAKKKGIKIKQGRIDVKLPFGSREFNYAICNVTLQMVMYPEILLKEMARISDKQIISFPNFAFVLNRLELIFKGRMPKTMIPGYEWYSTGHIHQLSIQDFINYCNLESSNLKIIDTHHIYPQSIFGSSKLVFKNYPNLFASTAIFLTKSKA